MPALSFRLLAPCSGLRSTTHHTCNANAMAVKVPGRARNFAMVPCNLGAYGACNLLLMSMGVLSNMLLAAASAAALLVFSGHPPMVMCDAVHALVDWS